MRFASLGSGSEGNGLLVEVSRGESSTLVLLDCGFTVKETERRLGRLGVLPQDIDAIVVTHEHGDHISGVFKLARRYSIPVWTTHGTIAGVQPRELEGLVVEFCLPDSVFEVGHVTVAPYAVPHDAREPVQYVFSDGSVRLGVLTDVGRSTSRIVEALSGCHALVLECNHDREMLARSVYPYALKMRIGGAFGHLENDDAAGLLAELDRRLLKTVVAAHLSRQNNTKELARAALARATGWTSESILVADQDQGLSWTNV